MGRGRQRARARRRCAWGAQAWREPEGRACRAHHIGHAHHRTLRRAQRWSGCLLGVQLPHRRVVVVGPGVGRVARWRSGARAEGGVRRGEPRVSTAAVARTVRRRSPHDRRGADPRSAHDRGCADPRPAVAVVLPLLCALYDPSRACKPRLTGQAVPLHRSQVRLVDTFALVVVARLQECGVLERTDTACCDSGCHIRWHAPNMPMLVGWS